MNERSDLFSRFAAPAAVGRIGNLGLGVGLVGTALLVLGLFVAPTAFFRAYLIGWVYWLAVALGCLALIMVHHLSGGAWGVVIRRPLEAAARTLPFLGLLSIPLVINLLASGDGAFEPIYSWAREAEVAGDHLVEHKLPYLNETGWILRLAVYFLVWIGAASLLTRWSARQDREPDLALIAKMKKVAAAGLVLYFLASSFAAFDWLMSLDPHWYSTMYGVWFVGGQGLAAMAFIILVVLFLAKREPMRGIYLPRHLHDYGKLLLAFTMLWAYFSLSQLLIIWSGNIPEEVLWYHERFHGGWQYVAVALAFLHFALPFLLLLSRDVKRDGKALTAVAVLLLVMRWVDLYWNVMPNFSPGRLTFHWLDLVAPLAIGGLWLWLFVRNLKSRPLLPVGDPYLEEAVADVGHH